MSKYLDKMKLKEMLNEFKLFEIYLGNVDIHLFKTPTQLINAFVASREKSKLEKAKLKIYTNLTNLQEKIEMKVNGLNEEDFG